MNSREDGGGDAGRERVKEGRREGEEEAVRVRSPLNQETLRKYQLP